MSSVEVAPDKKARGRKSGESVVTNRRDIPMSAYDLFGGTYTTAARARLYLLIVVTIVGVLAAGLAFQGFQANVSASAVSEELSGVDAERAQLITQFGTITGFEGVSERDLIARDQELSGRIQELLTLSPDFIALLSQIKDTSTAAGINVMFVDFKALTPPQAAEDSKKEDENEGESADQSLYSVEISAKSGDFNGVLSWAELLRSAGSLQDIAVANSPNAAVISGVYVVGRPSAAVEALLQELQIATRPAPPPGEPGSPEAATPTEPGAQPASPAPASPTPGPAPGTETTAP